MSTKEILIVDDEDIVLDILEKTLSQHGFTITTKTSPLHALDAMKEKNYPLVITDICMPELDGLSFIEEIDSSFPSTKVIAITGYGTDERLMKCIEMDCFGYVDKPFNIDYMVSLVSTAFD